MHANYQNLHVCISSDFDFLCLQCPSCKLSSTHQGRYPVKPRFNVCKTSEKEGIWFYETSRYCALNPADLNLIIVGSIDMYPLGTKVRYLMLDKS